MNYVAWVLKIAGKQGRGGISWFGQGEGGLTMHRMSNASPYVRL